AVSLGALAHAASVTIARAVAVLLTNLITGASVSGLFTLYRLDYRADQAKPVVRTAACVASSPAMRTDTRVDDGFTDFGSCSHRASPQAGSGLRAWRAAALRVRGRRFLRSSAINPRTARTSASAEP